MRPLMARRNRTRSTAQDIRKLNHSAHPSPPVWISAHIGTNGPTRHSTHCPLLRVLSLHAASPGSTPPSFPGARTACVLRFPPAIARHDVAVATAAPSVTRGREPLATSPASAATRFEPAIGTLALPRTRVLSAHSLASRTALSTASPRNIQEARRNGGRCLFGAFQSGCVSWWSQAA